MRRAVFALALALGAASLQGASGPKAEALFEAARQGDVAAARRLLEEGVDVNAKSRYGATALSFASEKGHLEVVRLLVERGAQLDVKDTFYGATPLSWAVSSDHAAVARLLVDKGAPGADGALSLAVKAKDADLARAVIARGALDPATRARAIGEAEASGAAEVGALLKAAPVLPEPTKEVAADTLRGYAGAFANDEAKLRYEVSLEGAALVVKGAGGTAWTLVPVADDRFKVKDVPEVWVRFGGRSGTTEFMAVQQGGTQHFLGRSAPASPAAAASRAVAPAAPAPAAALTTLPRTAPRAWPSFRGERASGIGDGQGAPPTWDVKTGANVRWKAEVPGLANSSPIVWGNRVFLTTAVSGKSDDTFRTGLYGDVDSVKDEGAHSWRVLALDLATGRTLWERTAHEGVPRVKRHLKSTHANSTPATDGKRVVALLGSEGLYAYDLDGKPLWKVDLGVLDSGWFYDSSYQWGFSSSPIIHGDRVIVQVDLQKGSYLAAFDLATGQERWRTAREEIPTWGTPTVVKGPGGDEVVTNGTTVRAYDPATGALLWSLGPNSEVTVATPVAAHDVVFVTAGYPPVRPIYAVRAGARGTLDLAAEATSSPSVAWSSTKDGTYIPTPVVYRGYLYTLHNNGRLSCYDARTGEVKYRSRVGNGGSFSASLVAADGRLYAASEDGEVFVVKAGPEYELLATNPMGEPIMATPAISNGALLVRTLRSLVAVGGP
jgi:outer membrane protein assembly factor BamB